MRENKLATLVSEGLDFRGCDFIKPGERQCRTNFEIGKQCHRDDISIKVVHICQPVGWGFTPQRSILFQHKNRRSILSIIALAS